MVKKKIGVDGNEHGTKNPNDIMAGIISAGLTRGTVSPTKRGTVWKGFEQRKFGNYRTQMGQRVTT